MEHIFELLFHGFAIILFCTAVSLLFYLSHNLDLLDQELKYNLYQEHVLYSHQVN